MTHKAMERLRQFIENSYTNLFVGSILFFREKAVSLDFLRFIMYQKVVIIQHAIERVNIRHFNEITVRFILNTTIGKILSGHK